MSFDFSDRGKLPVAEDLAAMARENTNFRTTIWSGVNLQVTLMTIPAGEEMGLETHAGIDQYYQVAEGEATAQVGKMEDNLEEHTLKAGDGILIPASMWHNVIAGDSDVKMFTFYGAIEHKPGTVHATKQDDLDDPHEH